MMQSPVVMYCVALDVRYKPKSIAVKSLIYAFPHRQHGMILNERIQENPVV